MNHRVWVLGTTLLFLIGCLHPQTRLQAPDDSDREKEVEVEIIGPITTVSNADPIPVSGVGLVIGLEGTGGEPPPGSYRDFLEKDLLKKNVDHIKEILASKNNSLVLVSALIPPGVHKGDPVDVEVTLPAHSKTTSLRGGYLKECLLYNYDTAKNLSPTYTGADRLFVGHELVKAEGAVLVGLGDNGQGAEQLQGRIWSGGRCKIDRMFYLVLNKDKESGPVVQRAAQRINETFHGPSQGSSSDVAEAKTKSFLVLKVPLQYKNNLPRYLRVVRLIPLKEAPALHSPYRHRLERELLDPAHTVTAALRLEALGNDSIPVLKKGLESEHPLVRFTSAEALAYLGDPACGVELAKLVERQPMLRAFSLTAMASLDEAISSVKLRELLAAPAAETRYGAFRALRALNENDPAVQGELLNDSFWLHRTALGSAPLVHVSTSRRAEVVLFGDEAVLVPPFSFLAGEFTVTAGRDDPRCTLTRRSVRHGTHSRQCSLKLEEVVRNLADLGGTYPEVLELLRQAGSYRCLNCPVAVDALPQAISVFDLAKDGVRNPDLLQTDEEILNAQDEFGATPTLYDKTPGSRPRSVLERGEAVSRRPSKPAE